MLGVVRLGGEAAYGGWGSRAPALEGLGAGGKEGSADALGIPGPRASPAKPFPPARGVASPRPLALPSRRGSPGGFSPWDPEAHGKGWENVGAADSWVPEDFGLAVLGPHPLVQPQAKALAPCKLRSEKKKQEEDQRLESGWELGDRMEKEVREQRGARRSPESLHHCGSRTVTGGPSSSALSPSGAPGGARPGPSRLPGARGGVGGGALCA